MSSTPPSPPDPPKPLADLSLVRASARAGIKRLGPSEGGYHFPNLHGQVPFEIEQAMTTARGYIYELRKGLGLEAEEEQPGVLLDIAEVAEMLPEPPDVPVIVKSYFIGVSVLTIGELTHTNTAPIVTADEVRCWSFILPVVARVNRITVNRTTGPAGGNQRYGIGLYDGSGRLVLQTGAKNVVGLVPGIDSFSKPLLSLQEGFYTLAITADVGANAIGFSPVPLSGSNNTSAQDTVPLFNSFRPMYYAKSSLSGVAGVLPAKLGTLSMTSFTAPHHQPPLVVFAEV